MNADIESVIKAVGHYTGMTFIIDPRVKGTLTLVSEKSLTKSQAFGLLTSALRLQGFAVVTTGEGYAKVVPEAEAKLQSSPTQVGKRGTRVQGDQIATQIFHLSYESAANLTAVLRPLISPNNSIMANPGNNSLVITDYADNLRRLARIIAALDAPVAADLDVVPIRNGIASDIATLVSRLMEPAAGGDSGRVTILADSRTNSVIVRAPSQARANLAKSLIAKLDQGTSEKGNIHVVYLKNADATKVAQTLRAVVSQDTSAVGTPQQGTSGGSIQAGAQGGAGGWRRPRRPAGPAEQHRRRHHRRRLRPAGPVQRRRRRPGFRLHPGRCLDQQPDHHRAGRDLPQPARRHRPARRAPRPGVYRGAGGRDEFAEGVGIRRAMAGLVGQRHQQVPRRRRAVLQQHERQHHRPRRGRARRPGRRHHHAAARCPASRSAFSR